MEIKIDWLSFTLPVGEGIDIISFADFQNEAHHQLMQIGKEHYEYIYDGSDFGPMVGRAPYRYQIQRADRGVRVFGGGPNCTILYELTGRACEGIRNAEAYTAFLSPVVDHVTRLDLACDVRTETRPTEFSNDRENGRFKSIGFQRSETGETVYIGSAKSDRFARVYRYNHPHPRAENLRIEFVFRRQLAKDTAKLIVAEGSVLRVAAAAGNTFGLKHPDWTPEIQTDEKLSAPQGQRTSDGTVAWLYRSVAPAIQRLLIEGSLDWDDWTHYIWYGDNDPRE